MIFASKSFLVFLAVVLVLYHGLGRRDHRYRVLLLASWLFYAVVPPHYWPVIFALTLIDYVAGVRIGRASDECVRRRWLTASIVANLGLLIGFKYTPFAYENAVTVAGLLGVPLSPATLSIVLPLGISYHTFQGISYTVDVYRRQIPAVTSFTDYALFVSFFPQLAAGPIVRAADFLPQMATPPTVTRVQIADGIVLFASGLVKKLLVADPLDQLLVGPVFADPFAYTDAAHRWAVIGWAVQIYCDFSGYTDMARGVSKWFGFELPENFNLPYLATSIADFWRRWHLSLSAWLRDYVYFPMGGSRGGELRTAFNLLALFVLCGLWHGAAWNWLAYGLFNGALMVLHRGYDRAVNGRPAWDALRGTVGWSLFAWAATALQFLVGLVMIRTANWPGGVRLTQSLLGQSFEPTSVEVATAVPLPVGVLVACGLAGHAVELLRRAGVPVPAAWPEPVRMFAAAAAFATVIVFAPGVSKTFLYVQF